MFGPGLGLLAKFCHELATMLEAGMPLPRALASLRNRSFRHRMRGILDRLISDIAGGSSFYQALERQPDNFPLLMRNLIRAGEESGNMEAVLARLGDYFDLQREVRRSLLWRLLYPTVLIIMTVVVVSLLMQVRAALAQLTSDQAGNQATNMSLDAVIASLGWGLVRGIGIVGILAIAAVAFMRFVLPLRGTQEALFMIPLAGRAVKYAALARFSWCMELMLRAGVPVRDSLERSLESTNNAAFTARIPKVLGDIGGGDNITEAMTKARLFPDEYMEYIATAEETGSMEETFGRVAKLYFDRAENALRTFSSALGWTVWISVAIVVAYVVVSFYAAYLGSIQRMAGGFG